MDAVISRRRGVLAVFAFTAGPAGTVWLTVHHRPLSAMVLGGLLLLYAVAEVLAFELRDHARAAYGRQCAHDAAAPILGDYCSQVEDRYYERVELRNGRVAM